MASVKTTTRELGDSRVRVQVQVEPRELERELQAAAREIGSELRVAGFRKGKVPPQVAIQRVGREAVLDEAVRRALPGWYEAAVADAGIAAVGDPKLDLSELPERGAPLEFSIEVAVRPTAKLGTYRGVEVGRREPEVADEEVDSELERLRESLASLQTVGREAREGDFVVIDFTGTVDGEPLGGAQARGYLLELGSGRLIPGFEEGLHGARAGERRELHLSLPDDFPDEEKAGQEALFEVEVKEVKEKRLPELDDEFALEAGGFDTLSELKGDIRAKLEDADRRAIDAEFREAAVDAVAAEARLDLPKELVHAKAHEMWHRTAHRLEHQGIDPNRYLELTGKAEEELVTEAEPEAERALRRESVLAAIVEAEGIDVSDDELLEALRSARAGQDRSEPSDKALRRSLKRAESQGTADALRDDIAMRKAVDLVAEQAKPIPVEQAKARKKLWTPGKEREGAAEDIWTPGS